MRSRGSWQNPGREVVAPSQSDVEQEPKPSAPILPPKQPFLAFERAEGEARHLGNCQNWCRLKEELILFHPNNSLPFWWL